MASKKVWPSAEDQIVAYEKQFHLYTELQTWRASNPKPTAAPGFLVDAEVYNTWRKKAADFSTLLYVNGWDGSQWTWDDAWDDPLVESVKKLSKYFQIRKFYRKQKIEMNWPEVSGKPANKIEVIAKIYLSIGNNFAQIAFKKGVVTVWLIPEKRGRR